jgi:hypothetical protein
MQSFLLLLQTRDKILYTLAYPLNDQEKIVEQFKLRIPSSAQMERQTQTSRPYGFQAGNREVILAMSFPGCYIALDC